LKYSLHFTARGRKLSFQILKIVPA